MNAPDEQAIPGMDAEDTAAFLAMVRGQPAPAPVRRGPSEERVMARIAALTAAAHLAAPGPVHPDAITTAATHYETWIMREVDHA